MARLGLARARRFTWDACASRTVQAYADALAPDDRIWSSREHAVAASG
jgi:hypothetical protein